MNPQTDHLIALKEILIPAANASNAKAMSAYMKNRFPFLGIKKPETELLTKEWMKISCQQFGNQYPSFTQSLWELPEREYQHIALVMLFKSKKHWDDQLIPLCENLITQKSWWDTVDALATKILGNYFLLYPDQLETKAIEWANSDNLWLQRTAILVQLKFKRRMNEQLLVKIISLHLSSKEFFLQKAIGWVLREYARINPDWVLQTCESLSLAPLSKREALKHFR